MGPQLLVRDYMHILACLHAFSLLIRHLDSVTIPSEERTNRMAPAAGRVALESLLRDRKLDATLTTALPIEPPGGDACAPTGLPSLDTQLRGGVPRGQVSEIVGPRSAGRTSVLRALMATATRRGELVALIDTLDRFDPASAVAAGVDLTRVLWVRGQDVPLTQLALAPGWEPSRPRSGRTRDSVVARALDRAIKAVNLVLQSGGFGLVALDIADVPLDAVRELPFNTWMRLQRVVDASDTACVLVADVPSARSAKGVSIRLQPQRSRREAVRSVSREMPPRPRTGVAAVCDARHCAGAQDAQHGSGSETEAPRGMPPQEGLAPDAFHAAVLASRRPFVPRTGSRGITGRWAGTASPLPRLRGLAADATVVRAQHQAHVTVPVGIEFVE
jgi:recombination protein RecA